MPRKAPTPRLMAQSAGSDAALDPLPPHNPSPAGTRASALAFPPGGIRLIPHGLLVLLMRCPMGTKLGRGHEKSSSFRCGVGVLRRTRSGSAEPHRTELGRPSPRRFAWPSQHFRRGRRARCRRHEGSSPDHTLKGETGEEVKGAEGEDNDVGQSGNLRPPTAKAV